MKKEKNSVSPSQVKPGLPLASVNSIKEEVTSGGGGSPPAIKSDPDAVVNGENSNNNCDNSTPPTPGSGGQADPPDDPSTGAGAEDKKPVIGSGTSSGPPSNCNTGNGLIKSETDPFLDTFDSKDGGKNSILYLSFLYHGICTYGNSSKFPVLL